MNRKTFVKTSALAGISGVLLANGLTFGSTRSDFLPYIPESPAYALDALEPHIDALTMKIHSEKHHKAYSDNLNKSLLSADAQWQQMSLTELFEKIESLPSNLKTGIQNHGGGHWNHNFFWKCMQAPGNQAPEGKLKELLIRDFQSVNDFTTAFQKAALSVFGSGWAWLVLEDNALKILTTPNQTNPLMGKNAGSIKPLLGIDVWEHAYYLKYQNRRAEYLEQFRNVINWDFISAQLG